MGEGTTGADLAHGVLSPIQGTYPSLPLPDRWLSLLFLITVPSLPASLGLGGFRPASCFFLHRPLTVIEEKFFLGKPPLTFLVPLTTHCTLKTMGLAVTRLLTRSLTIYIARYGSSRASVTRRSTIHLLRLGGCISY